MRPRTDSRSRPVPSPARRRSAPGGAPTLALTLALAVALAGCGGDEPASGGASPTPDFDTASARGAGPAGGDADDTTTAPAPAPDSSAPAAGGEDVAGEEAGPDLPAWSTGPLTGEGASGRMVGVRTGRHDDFDRLVLVFSDRVPGYTIGYPDEPLRQCGSGRPVDMAAPALLHLHLEPASAHNQRGHSTLSERELSPGLPVIRSARLVCDYEGHVEWAVGMERRTPFRVFTLERPARLVVDVRHDGRQAGR